MGGVAAVAVAVAVVVTAPRPRLLGRRRAVEVVAAIPFPLGGGGVSLGGGDTNCGGGTVAEAGGDANCCGGGTVPEAGARCRRCFVVLALARGRLCFCCACRLARVTVIGPNSALSSSSSGSLSVSSLSRREISGGNTFSLKKKIIEKQ